LDQTPDATAASIIVLGNLHPGVDGTWFLLVFAVGLGLFISVIYASSRIRRTR
jgi:hypothetical protein